MGRPQVYDWTKILEEGAELEEGQDFDVPIRTMQISVLREAQRRKVKVTTSTRHGVVLVVRPVRAGRHDWATLLNGDVQRIFYADLPRTTTPEGFIRQARRAARARDLRIRVKRVSNGLVMQALDRG